MSRNSVPITTSRPVTSRTVGENGHAVQDATSAYFGPTSHSANGVLVTQLLGEALAVFDDDRPQARGCVERAHLIMQGQYRVAFPRKGMLADWQVRKAVHHIHGNLEATLRMDEAAKLVNLSSGHFSRAFKVTTGLTYSQYVIQARIDLAKHLLLTSNAPISQIALMCGLSDQPHLNRLFRRIVGLPPSSWRRRAADPPRTVS